VHKDLGSARAAIRAARNAPPVREPADKTVMPTVEPSARSQQPE
jgi:hypothetical protein